MERLTRCVGFQNDKPIYKTNIDMRKIGSVDELKNALGHYEDLEEQGLLLKLPCKVGDMVYVKMASHCDIQYAEAEVRDFTHFTSCGFCAVVTSKHFDKQNIPFADFGKTAFLTQDEAEEKLKGIKQ